MDAESDEYDPNLAMIVSRIPKGKAGGKPKAKAAKAKASAAKRAARATKGVAKASQSKSALLSRLSTLQKELVTDEGGGEADGDDDEQEDEEEEDTEHIE